MNQACPRFRMFAGPNGSGKSIIKKAVPLRLLGIYVNPDEIERQIRDTGGCLNFSDFGVKAQLDEVLAYFRWASRWDDSRLAIDLNRLTLTDDKLNLSGTGLNSYLGSVLAEFIRAKLMRQSTSFSTETVMSHESKVALLKDAQAAGYRTYLYYVATEHPDINCFRVRQRVLQGGHDVPEEKIRERYRRSLDLVMDAVKYTNRAYFFDNSYGEQQVYEMWVAEVTEAKLLELKQNWIPQWFQESVWNKL